MLLLLALSGRIQHLDLPHHRPNLRRLRERHPQHSCSHLRWLRLRWTKCWDSIIKRYRAREADLELDPLSRRTRDNNRSMLASDRRTLPRMLVHQALLLAKGSWVLERDEAIVRNHNNSHRWASLTCELRRHSLVCVCLRLNLECALPLHSPTCERPRRNLTLTVAVNRIPIRMPPFKGSNRPASLLQSHLMRPTHLMDQPSTKEDRLRQLASPCLRPALNNRPLHPLMDSINSAQRRLSTRSRSINNSHTLADSIPVLSATSRLFPILLHLWDTAIHATRDIIRAR